MVMLTTSAEKRKAHLKHVVSRLRTVKLEKFGSKLIYPGDHGLVAGSTPRSRENIWRQKLRDPDCASARSVSEVDITIALLAEFLEDQGYDLASVGFGGQGVFMGRSEDAERGVGVHDNELS